MRRSEVQRDLRKSDIQGEVFSFLWNRRGASGGVRLSAIYKHLGRPADRVKNGMDVLITRGYAEQLSRGVYKVSGEVTK